MRRCRRPDLTLAEYESNPLEHPNCNQVGLADHPSPALDEAHEVRDMTTPATTTIRRTSPVRADREGQ